MAVAGEIVDKPRPDVVDAAHVALMPCGCRPLRQIICRWGLFFLDSVEKACSGGGLGCPESHRHAVRPLKPKVRTPGFCPGVSRRKDATSHNDTPRNTTPHLHRPSATLTQRLPTPP